MALTDENGGGIPATMLVSPSNVGGAYPVPMYGGNNGNNGFGDGGWWIILVIIILAALGGNWGGNNGGGFGGQPIIVNDGGGSSVQRGFDQAATMAGLSGIQGGIAGLSTQLCGCCGDLSMQMCNGFNGVINQMSNNALASLERSFAAQTANTAGMNALQAQFAQCCCDNRLATESLRATVLSENCADRYEAANNTRNIIESQTRSTQSILDKLCQLELDGYKRENDALRDQLSDARLAASQNAQTAAIRDGQNASVAALVNELRSCPIPAQPVYGSQPIFTCPNNNNNGCGCGCNGGF